MNLALKIFIVVLALFVLCVVGLVVLFDGRSAKSEVEVKMTANECYQKTRSAEMCSSFFR